MLRLLLCFAMPIQILRIQDVEFNRYLNDVLLSVSAIGYFLPKYFKQEKICKIDEDCPDIMRCCEVGLKKYCCSPNNFVKNESNILKQRGFNVELLERFYIK